MRKTIMTMALSAGLIATSANADQKTLDAMIAAGVTLTTEQSEALASAACNGADCSALTAEVAAIVAANSTDDAAVENILKAAAKAHPNQATQFGEAAIEAAPEATAVIAQVMTETSATAAGGNNGENGRVRARSVANPNNNIPTPPGGGGSSSPN